MNQRVEPISIELYYCQTPGSEDSQVPPVPPIYSFYLLHWSRMAFAASGEPSSSYPTRGGDRPTSTRGEGYQETLKDYRTLCGNSLEGGFDSTFQTSIKPPFIRGGVTLCPKERGRSGVWVSLFPYLGNMGG